MEEGKEGEWWGDTENSGAQGVLTGTPSQGGSGEQGQSGPYVQPMMMMQPSNDEATWSMVLGIVTWISWISSPVLCFTVCICAIFHHWGCDTRPCWNQKGFGDERVEQGYGNRRPHHELSVDCDVCFGGRWFWINRFFRLLVA